jgi:hypothetical protein
MIQFFKHDKPVEFYGKDACLVRNHNAPGTYVIRVPVGTPMDLIQEYKKFFEGRQSVGSREIEYFFRSLYAHEREVGINYGKTLSELGSTATRKTFYGQAQGPPLFISAVDETGNPVNYYLVPVDASDKENTELNDQTQSFLDDIVDEHPSVSIPGESSCLLEMDSSDCSNSATRSCSKNKTFFGNDS